MSPSSHVHGSALHPHACFHSARNATVPCTHLHVPCPPTDADELRKEAGIGHHPILLHLFIRCTCLQCRVRGTGRRVSAGQLTILRMH